MSWAAEFPQELQGRPKGFAVLSGLDTTYNAIHKAIWDLFCNNRKHDRVPLKFVLHPVDHEYPKAKPKRSSYEFYMPKGVLRRDWMKKHLDYVPSLIITFFDLDWDDPHWDERVMECSSRLQIIRSSVERRSTKLAVVLIQRTPPLPPGEDNLTKERAAAFCTKCELSQKSLFVLPHADHLYGYVIRLENAFYDLSQNYYTANIRRVRMHRDYLNRTTHQLLFIRHQFKIAFFTELKQETQMALKHYKQAYGHCLETKLSDSNVLEIKVIAGFINYKICALSFSQNAPLDALEQFRKHIEQFKHVVGPPSLAFEHSAWLSMQFQLLGDLFEEAVKNGLAAIQTQHPGFYYKQSADHAIMRKQLCIGICHSGGDVDSMKAALESLEFYGQRPWRAGQQALEILDQAKEDQGIIALQSIEKTVNHSMQIIQLLNLSVNQFRKFKCTRMRWSLLVMMGEEHYSAKEYPNAIHILLRVAQEYRKERWWALLTSVLTTTIKCAYLLADVQDYIRLCIELMAEQINRSIETKTRIQADLLQVVSGDVPDPEPGIDPNTVNAASSKWQQVLEDAAKLDPDTLSFNLSETLSFIDCKVAFEKKKYNVDDQVRVWVYIKCYSQFSMRFSHLQLMFDDERFSAECNMSDDGDLLSVIEEDQISTKDLLFLSNEVKAFSFVVNTNKDDMGKRLEVTSVQLKLIAKLAVTLDIPVTSSDQSDNQELPTLQFSSERLPCWEAIHSQSYTELNCRESLVEVAHTHHESCLLNELFPIKVTFLNNENLDLDNIKCSFVVEEGSSPCFLSLEAADVLADRSSNECYQQKQLSMGSQIETTFYIRATEVGTVNLSVTMMYEMPAEQVKDDREQYRQRVVFSVPVIEPFRHHVRFLTTKFADRESANANEPFIIQFTVENLVDCAIYIKEAQLHLSEYFPEDQNQLLSQIADIILYKDEQCSECQCLVTQEAHRNEILPGEYTVVWRRESDQSDDSLVTTKFVLPSLTIEHQPVYVQCCLPAYGKVNEPLDLQYILYNRTGYVQEFEASIDNSDSFVFSGHKQLHFRTLPHASQSIAFTLYPLTPGNLCLPQFRINMLKHDNITEAINKMIPGTVYIMPKENT